jgi:hypothetical protein
MNHENDLELSDGGLIDALARNSSGGTGEHQEDTCLDSEVCWPRIEPSTSPPPKKHPETLPPLD